VILVVDDSSDIGRTLCRLFTINGYPCEWVPDGPTGLARVRSHPPEQPLLVVLDETMPDMSGLEVLQHLRSDPATKRTPVVLYTAAAEESTRRRAMSLSVLEWLRKGSAAALEEIMRCYERVGGARQQP
jgi:CheY-like chemotaxis protein